MHEAMKMNPELHWRFQDVDDGQSCERSGKESCIQREEGGVSGGCRWWAAELEGQSHLSPLKLKSKTCDMVLVLALLVFGFASVQCFLTTPAPPPRTVPLFWNGNVYSLPLCVASM